MKLTARLIDDAAPRPGPPFAESRPCPLAAIRLVLSNFRSYRKDELRIEPSPVVLTGPNGAGKTNLLEALSLLSPGRGLRGAKLFAIQRRAPAEAAPGNEGREGLWAVSATLVRPEGHFELGTGLIPAPFGAPPRRTLRLNGAPAESADIVELLPILWLTPSMDRLFLEGAAERRRFLDRLVFALDAPHARRVARYERAMQERLHLLREGVRNRAWLEGLEQAMAEAGAEVTAARLSLIERLNAELQARRVESAFPCAQLALGDSLGGEANDPARLESALAASRERDAAAGRTLVGPHLADLEVRHSTKRADARDCSTGEQKALLVSIVLANAWLQKKRRGGIAPLLLLDEIAAHLDLSRRQALYEEIVALGSQAWLTGTDRHLFAPLEGRAAFLTVEPGRPIEKERP